MIGNRPLGVNGAAPSPWLAARGRRPTPQADLAAAGLEKRVCFAYPPMEVEGQGGLRIAQFKDPDGNVIGIMKSPAM
jgi:hypothetical protein